jgi:thioredoxin-related protein
MTRLIAALVLVFSIVPTVLPAGAAELVIFEQDYCSWCERWHEEIGPIYPKTAESRRAPLRRVDIHDPLPADLDFLQKSHFTPTFVLIDDGREIGRILGYPGEDFFWGLLGEMMKRLQEQQ